MFRVFGHAHQGFRVKGFGVRVFRVSGFRIKGLGLGFLWFRVFMV